MNYDVTTHHTKMKSTRPRPDYQKATLHLTRKKNIHQVTSFSDLKTHPLPIHKYLQRFQFATNCQHLSSSAKQRGAPSHPSIPSRENHPHTNHCQFKSGNDDRRRSHREPTYRHTQRLTRHTAHTYPLHSHGVKHCLHQHRATKEPFSKTSQLVSRGD
jgi:hypothetical protein